jgi:ribosomal protein S18 acetylase RimI-like enzyme
MMYRPGSARDIEAIAALHADSWRRNYRGAYLDSYLDGDVVADRTAVWTARLTDPQTNQHTIVAELDGAVHGFAHTFLDDDPTWGALLENLHVTHAVKRRGIGRGLIVKTARVVVERGSVPGMYLSVLEQNQPAQAFYGAQGGICVERRLAGPFPGGGTAFVLIYAWPDPATLLERP